MTDVKRREVNLDLKQLKEDHATALREGNGEFTTQGLEFVTPYGGYLIDYIETETLRDNLWVSVPTELIGGSK